MMVVVVVLLFPPAPSEPRSALAIGGHFRSRGAFLSSKRSG